MKTSTLSPWLVALALLVVFVVVVVATTPWHPFGESGVDMVAADAARDFTAAERAAADAYRQQIRPPIYLGMATGLVALLVLALTPLGARLVTAVSKVFSGGGTGPHWVWEVLLGGLALLLVVRVTTLGFSAWAESVRRDYGLSTRDWGSWLGDVGRSFGLELVVTLAAVLVMVALARAMPQWWWVPAAGGGAAAVVALSFVYPLVVEPVFNNFRPMADGELRSSLVAIAHQEGIEVDEVLVADASRRTTTLNAYVSGFGTSHRIVVYDNLMAQAPDAEIRQVVAHELGHTAEHDVRDGTLLGALGAAAGVCVLAGMLSWGRLLGRAGADGPADPRVLALVLAIVAVLGTVAAPVENLISRRVETRADVRSLDMAGDPGTFVRMQHRLAVTSYSDLDPPPLLFAMYASHPTAPQRIALARTWARENGANVPTNLADGA